MRHCTFSTAGAAARAFSCAASLAVAIAPVARSLLAQTPDRPQPAADDSESAPLIEARTQVQTLSVTLTPTGDKASLAAEFIATPVMHYSDQQRGFTDSTLWVWQSKGRPVLFSKLERLLDGNGATSGWQFCCTPTCDGTVRIQSGRRVNWSSRGQALTWQDFDSAPPPADSAPRRLIQMRSLASGFRGEIENTPIKEREQMRRLTHPVHRYEAPAAGLVDGAVFALTSKGTNPDSLLLIEAVESDSHRHWRFGIIAMTGDAVSIRLGEDVVFQQNFTGVPGDYRSWVWFLAPSVVTPEAK